MDVYGAFNSVMILVRGHQKISIFDMYRGEVVMQNVESEGKEKEKEKVEA